MSKPTPWTGPTGSTPPDPTNQSGSGLGGWRAPDLIGRDVGTGELNRKWCGDGTEILTDDGKLFPGSVLDMGSRRIVGFCLGEHHNANLVSNALVMAVPVRGGKPAVASVVLHTDPGAANTPAAASRPHAPAWASPCPWGGPGSALDNAVIESWHSTLEFELRSLEEFATKGEARRAVADWIDDYNHDRRHSALRMRSPIDYELSHPEPDHAA